MQTFNQEQFPGCIYNNFFALLMANLRLRPFFIVKTHGGRYHVLYLAS